MHSEHSLYAKGFKHKLDKVTELKARERLKDSNLGTYSALKYISFHYCRIFQNNSISRMLIATTFLQNVASHTFHAMHFLDTDC